MAAYFAWAPLRAGSCRGGNFNGASQRPMRGPITGRSERDQARGLPARAS
jgi:hypothetical protein